MNKNRNVKNKGCEVLDEDSKSVTGGTVSKLIYADGHVEYRANSSENNTASLYGGELSPPHGWRDGFDGQPSNRFFNREDAEKYAKERNWSTDGHTFREHTRPILFGLPSTYWTKE